jgi:hypothetical protein
LELNSINEKNIIINYLNMYKLKGEKKKRFKYWKYLFNLECKYIETGVQNFEEIENALKKLNSTIDEGELSKV